jgi:glycosyltransferase involved in cell wall biosynthesis
MAEYRVAIVTSSYLPELGGLESYTSALARALLRSGCEVDVLTQSPHGKAEKWETAHQERGLLVRRFDDVTRSRRFRISPSLWSYLRREGNRYDVLHAHNIHGFAALAAAVSNNAPLLLSPHFHGVGHSTAAKVLHIPYDRLAVRIFDRSSSIVCDSAAEADLVRMKYPDYAARVRVAGTGIDVDGILKSSPFAGEPPTVLAGGRMVSYKRLDVVVAAFAQVASDAQLVITGGGPEESRIRSLIEELRLGHRVRVLGRVDSADLTRWQRTAAVFVSLSTQEAFGLSVAEAAVAGAAVVASDIPAHREVLALAGQELGLVALNAHTSDIAKSINMAISAEHRAPAKLGFRSWENVAEDVLESYREAIQT